MGKSIFITGTDTDVGKTVITACLAAALLRKGMKVAVYKPVQCGSLLKGKVKSPDLALVKKLSGISENNLFNDYSFKFASSPHLAAELEHKKVDVDVIKNQYNKLSKKFDYVLIEGAGGLLVPLTREYTVMDLIKELEVPALVIARAGLGTINHTSLTISALKSKKIKIIGIIMNYFKGGKIEEDNKKIIGHLNGIPIVGSVPFSKNLKKIAGNFEEYVDLQKIFSS
mgnify:CR=1 FL=1